MRVHSLCKILRKMDILQDVLALTHKRSLDKYSELDREDDFDETAEAPEIQCKFLQCHDSMIKWQEVIAVSFVVSADPSETRNHSTQLLYSPSYRYFPETGE